MNPPLTQAHIQHLAQRINRLHQGCRAERIRLAEWEADGLRPFAKRLRRRTGGHRPFSILGELEILAGNLQGYAGRYGDDGLRLAADHRMDAAAMADLQQRLEKL